MEIMFGTGARTACLDSSMSKKGISDEYHWKHSLQCSKEEGHSRPFEDAQKIHPRYVARGGHKADSVHIRSTF